MKLPDAGSLGKNSSCSGVPLVRFLAGRARALFRNSRKDVLPEFVVPTMRMLVDSTCQRWIMGCNRRATHLKGVGSFLLRTLLGLLMVLTALLA